MNEENDILNTKFYREPDFFEFKTIAYSLPEFLFDGRWWTYICHCPKCNKNTYITNGGILYKSYECQNCNERIEIIEFKNLIIKNNE